MHTKKTKQSIIANKQLKKQYNNKETIQQTKETNQSQQLTNQSTITTRRTKKQINNKQTTINQQKKQCYQRKEINQSINNNSPHHINTTTSTPYLIQH